MASQSFHHTPANLNLEIINIYRILSQLEGKIPPGTIILFAVPSANPTNENLPDGWLLCNGNKFSIDRYPELFKAIGLGFSLVASNSVFQVPNIVSPTVAGGSVGNLAYIIKT